MREISSVGTAKLTAGSFPRNLTASALAVLAVSVGAALLLFPDSFAPNTAFIDEWVYLGLAQDYWDMTLQNYKHSRMSWLFPLAIATAYGDGIAGFLILQGLFLFLGVSMLYLILRRIGNHNLALVFSSLAVLYFPLAASGGAAYHTTASGPLLALTTYLVLVASSKPIDKIYPWVTVGVGLALALHANIHVLFTLPYLAVLAVLVGLKIGRPLNAVTTIIRVSMGALGTTAALGVIAVLNGQPFLFWVKGVYTALVASNNLESWWLPLRSDWLAVASYLLVPTIALSLSLVVTAKLHFGKNPITLSHVWAKALAAGFLILAIIWIALQQAGILMLQPEYYASLLQYPALAVVGSSLCLTLTRNSDPGDFLTLPPQSRTVQQGVPLSAVHTSSPTRATRTALAGVLVAGTWLVSVFVVVTVRYSLFASQVLTVQAMWLWAAAAILTTGLAVVLARAPATLLIAAVFLLIMSLIASTPANRSLNYLVNCRGSQVGAMAVALETRRAILSSLSGDRPVMVIVVDSILDPPTNGPIESLSEASISSYSRNSGSAKTCVWPNGRNLPANTLFLFAERPVTQLRVARNQDLAEPLRELSESAGVPVNGWDVIIFAPDAIEAARAADNIRDGLPYEEKFQRIVSAGDWQLHLLGFFPHGSSS